MRPWRLPARRRHRCRRGWRRWRPRAYPPLASRGPPLPQPGLPSPSLPPPALYLFISLPLAWVWGNCRGWIRRYIRDSSKQYNTAIILVMKKFSISLTMVVIKINRVNQQQQQAKSERNVRILLLLYRRCIVVSIRDSSPILKQVGAK